MLAEEPDVRKALVRFREGLGGNLRGAPSLLDLRLVAALAAAPGPWDRQCVAPAVKAGKIGVSQP